MTLEEQLRAQGGDWNIQGVDRATELADLLRLQGVTSLDGLALQTGTGKRLAPGSWSMSGDNDVWNEPYEESFVQNQLQIGGKNIGFLGDYNRDGTYGNKAESYLKGTDGSMLGWSSRGDGAVGYHAVVGPDGKTRIVPHWGDTSDKNKALTIAAGMAVPLGAWGLGLGAAGGAGAAAGAGAATSPLNIAAIEAGLGTAGYGANAGAAASGLFNPVLLGSGALSSFGGSAMDPFAAYLTSGGADGSLGALNSLVSSASTPGSFSAASGFGAEGLTGAQTSVYDMAVKAGLSPELAATLSSSPTGSSILNSLSGIPDVAKKGFTDWVEKITGGGKGTVEGVQDLMKLYGLYSSLTGGGGTGAGGGGSQASLASLQAAIGNPNGTWNAAQNASAQKYFTAPLTKYQAPPSSRFGVDPMNPVYPKYAEGGEVDFARDLQGQGAITDAERSMLLRARGQGALSDLDVRRLLSELKGRGAITDAERTLMQREKSYAHGGDVSPLGRIAHDVRAAAHHGPGYVANGPGGGQDDMVEARLSPGEYVFDADLVAALGDGSNEEGARRLDMMRERVRAHKRGGSVRDIPPRAHDPEHYLKQKG